MYKEKPTSLFLPLFTGVLLVFIFLSGITEVACLASYARKSGHLTKTEIKARAMASADGNAQKMLSSVGVADVLTR